MVLQWCHFMRVVVDTNVLFEGLTKTGACADVVDLWAAREITVCVSTALALEYEEVLTNKLGEPKRAHALPALQALLNRVEFIAILTRVRPMSPDPDDDLVIECAYNGHADIVTRNTKDLGLAEAALGVRVLTPEQFLELREENEDGSTDPSTS